MRRTLFVQQRRECFRNSTPLVRRSRPKVEIFVRLDLSLVSSCLESVLDNEEIECLEVFDVNVVPGVGTFTDVRYFFTAQRRPVNHRGSQMWLLDNSRGSVVK